VTITLSDPVMPYGIIIFSIFSYFYDAPNDSIWNQFLWEILFSIHWRHCFNDHVISYNVIICCCQIFSTLRRELLLDLFPQFSVSKLYYIMLEITFSYVKYADNSKNVFSLILLLLFWLLREYILMIPNGIIGSIRVYIILCKYYFYFF